MVFTRKHSANDSEKNGSSYRWIGRSTVDNGKCDFAAASPPRRKIPFSFGYNHGGDNSRTTQTAAT